MWRCLQLVWIAVVAICSPSWCTEDHLIPASRDPCLLGGLTVTYGHDLWPCESSVPISKFDSQPPKVKLLPMHDTAGEYLTLVMVDPDVPSRDLSNGFYWLHWLVFNVEREVMLEGFDGNSGVVYTEYARPSPPKNAGLHRYQFFLFEQPENFDESQMAIHDRANFDLKKFLEENGFTSPVAGYQFLTKVV